MEHLDGLGPVYVEPVAVGILLKSSRTFAQLRPKHRWVARSFSLPRVVEHPKIARKVLPAGRRHRHAVTLRGPDDGDDDVRAGLTEAYCEP